MGDVRVGIISRQEVMELCPKCKAGMKYTFNMTMDCCRAKFLLSSDRATQRAWLDSFRKQYGEDRYLELVENVKTIKGMVK